MSATRCQEQLFHFCNDIFSNNEFVSMDVLVKICRALNCDIGDIVEVVPITNEAL